MKVTKEHIGQIVYPIDNSYGEFLDNGDKASPANMRGQVASPVKVLSEPFTPLSNFNGNRLLDFVLVEYKGRECKILNIFHKDLIAAEMSAQHDREQDMNDPLFRNFNSL